MKVLNYFCAASVVTASVALSANASDTTTFIEGFDTAQDNEGGWHFAPFDSWQSSGGNPGGYRRVDGLDTFAPMPRTQMGSDTIFHGNYQDLGVTSIGIDLRTFNNPTTGGRPLTLMLIRDTSAAYYLGPNIPSQGQGWVSYDFDVPSDSQALPPGWQMVNLNDSGSPTELTWRQILQDVHQVRFFYGDPTMFFIFQMWNLGMDNVRITYAADEPGVPGDLTGDGTVGVQDLLIMLGSWGVCADPADCPADLTGDGSVGVQDLLILLGNWS